MKICSAIVASAMISSAALAQPALTTPTAPVATVPIEAIKPIVAQPIGAAPAQVFLPANTEVVMAMNNDLTTKGGKIDEGTTFNLTVVNDVKLGDFVIIPKGARGTGEVTWKTGKAAFGKSGKMEVELRWVEVGGQRIAVEGKYRQEGEGNTVATVGTVLVAGVFAAFVTGKSARIPAGRELVAHTKDAIPVSLPPGATLQQTLTAIPATATSALPAAAAPAAPAAAITPTKTQ